MTRDDAHEKLHFGNRLNYQSFWELHSVIDKIFDDIDLEIQSSRSCDGCINKPLPKGNYPEACETCSRFYADNYEDKK